MAADRQSQQGSRIIHKGGPARPGSTPRDGIKEILRAERMPGFVANTDGRYVGNARIPVREAGGIRTARQALAMERDAARQVEEARKNEREQRRMGGKRAMHHKARVSFDEFAVMKKQYGKDAMRDPKERERIFKRHGKLL